MNSPIHHPRDLDAVLRYAPPRLRARAQRLAIEPSPSLAELPIEDQHLGDSLISGQRAIRGVSPAAALDPEIVPPPPTPLENNRGLWKIALRMFGIAGLAALGASIVVWGPSARQFWRDGLLASVLGTPVSNKLSMRDLASRAPATRLPDRADVQAELDQEAVKEPRNQSDLTAQSEEAGATTITPGPRVAALEPSPAVQSAAPIFVTKQLDHDEVASLIKRGEDFIRSGDFSSARLLLRRAADAGDARAALALAGTFDPNQLEKLGFQQLAVDPAMARFWYERAEKLGSAEALSRLQQLAAKIKTPAVP